MSPEDLEDVVEEAVQRHPSSLPPLTRRRRTWLAPVGGVAAVIALVALLLGFGLSRDPTVLRPALEGRRVPDFALRTLDGRRTVRLLDLRGQVVVINFWASWCAPCRDEAPALEAAWDRYRDRGVVVLGISFQDEGPDAKRFAREFGKTYPLLADPGSRVALSFGVYGVPETFFIGRDGRLAFKQAGPVSYELLARQITRLLEDRSA